MEKAFLENSFFVCSCMKIYLWLVNCKSKLVFIWNNSRTGKFFKSIFKSIYLNFWDKIFQKLDILNLILSKALNYSYFSKFLEKNRPNMYFYCEKSLTAGFAEKLKKELSMLSVKTVQRILFIAIFTEGFLTVIFAGEFSVLAWTIRGLFLFVSFFSQFYEGDWHTLASGSIFIKSLSGK